MRLEVFFEVVERLDVRVHAFFLRIRDEYDAVDALQDQLARCFIKNLPGNCVEVKACFKAAHRSQLERHKVEEERAIRLSRETDELAFRLRRGRVVDMLK